MAVVGAGPAGLSAAATLALKGYGTVIFEKMPEPGGQLRYGIPDHRLSPELVEHEIALVRGLGVQIECEHPISTQADLEGLFEQGFDAVFLAPGYDRAYSLGLGDDVSTGLYAWNDFLAQSKDAEARPALADAVSGQSVVVVGGGAVAMDCAVTAKRLGAARVYAVSLESMEELPADEDEKDPRLSRRRPLQVQRAPDAALGPGRRRPGRARRRDPLARAGPLRASER